MHTCFQMLVQAALLLQNATALNCCMVFGVPDGFWGVHTSRSLVTGTLPVVPAGGGDV